MARDRLPRHAGSGSVSQQQRDGQDGDQPHGQGDQGEMEQPARVAARFAGGGPSGVWRTAAGRGGKGVRWRGAGDGSASPRSRSERTLGPGVVGDGEQAQVLVRERRAGAGGTTGPPRPRRRGSACSRAGSVQRARSASELGAGLVALVRVLGHQLADDRREGGRDAAGDAARGARDRPSAA